MPKYLFSNDLRISTLSDRIKWVADYVQSGKQLNDIEEKSDNNNATTLEFYFGLYKDSSTIIIAQKDPKSIIRNFIKKFQFPNPRTLESFNESLSEGIFLAPYRAVISLLVAMYEIDRSISSYLTFNEILYYVFCNRKINSDPSTNYEIIGQDIISNRDKDIDLENKISAQLNWKQHPRQIREMMTILNYGTNSFKCQNNRVTYSYQEEDQEFINEIISCKDIWYPSNNSDYKLSCNEYNSFIDMANTPYSIINFSKKNNSIDFEIVELTKEKKYYELLTALRTKPFLLLAGISGTGKSRIVKKMAFDTCPNIDGLRNDKTSPGNYQLIEVKPNWHDSTEVLGYESEIGGVHYVTTPFIKFLVKAMCYTDTPFFVCMDEMNLAPVEQYFAEFLSVLESRKLLDDGRITSEPLVKADVFKKAYDQSHDIFVELGLKKVSTSVGKAENDKLGENATTEAFERQDIVQRLQEEGLRLPQNLIVVGTVNMDETTHQFSRKVIDRAMTIEMNIAEGAEPFTDFFNNKEDLQYRSESISKDFFLCNFVQASEAMESLNENDCKCIIENVPQKLSKLNNALNNTPFKIAYRVQNELVLYFASLRQENEGTPVEELFSSALDGILMMKVLPRIEGDEDLLEKPLKELAAYTQGLTQSAKKIEEMKTQLERVHFTSFWP